MRGSFSVIPVSLSPRIKLATMSAMSVLISVGAVLGKTNLLQLTLMALVEVTVFVTMMMIDRHYLNVSHGAVRRGLWRGGVWRWTGVGTTSIWWSFWDLKIMKTDPNGVPKL